MDIKYTAKYTRQQYSTAETLFTTLATRRCTMLTAVNVPMVEQYCLFQEVANHATNADRVVIAKGSKVKKVRMEHYEMRIPVWTQNVLTWGEASTIMTEKK